MTFLNRYFTRFLPAWRSYQGSQAQFWWPLSYLLLTPLAVIIGLGLIIPLGLASYGLVNFDHPVINVIYILLVAALAYTVMFPFLDGVYQLIFADFKQIATDENYGFKNLSNSKEMGIALFPIIVMYIVLAGVGAKIQFVKLLLILVASYTVFTPILNTNDQTKPWSKFLESVQLGRKNGHAIRNILVIRALIVLTVLVPALFMVVFSALHLKFLFAISLMLGLPTMFYLVVRILPFYFYYPAYVYQFELGQPTPNTDIKTVSV